MPVVHRMPPQLEEWDNGAGLGQAPIRAPYSYDAISPVEQYGDVVNLANFGQEIYTASSPSTSFTGMLNIARTVTFSNASQVQHGWAMPQDGVICWGAGIEDAGAAGQVDIWLQWTNKVKTFQAFGGVTAMNIGFKAGDYLNLEVNTFLAVDRPIVFLGIKWILPDQL